MVSITIESCLSECSLALAYTRNYFFPYFMKICWQELLLERQPFFLFKPEVLPSVCLEGRNPASWKYVECIQLGIDNQKHLENVLSLWSKIVSLF